MGRPDIGALHAAMHAVLEREQAAPRRAGATRRKPGRAGARPKDNKARWVPIGPSVVRRGQAEGRPRVAGRVRDIVLDAKGVCAYAGSGKGGVWYTGDAGRSWTPVGGWDTSVQGTKGGLSTDMSCGALLVDFGTVAGDDYVMVGTGERIPDSLRTGVPLSLDVAGRGVLAGLRPILKGDNERTFEVEAGGPALENLSIRRLVRDPAKEAARDLLRRETRLGGQAGDRVLAATTNGLYLGVRTADGAALKWVWTELRELARFNWGIIDIDGTGGDKFHTDVTDVLWIPVTGAADGRIIVAISGNGVAFSDALGVAGSWKWVPKLNRDTDSVKFSGRISFSAIGTDLLYVLGGTDLKKKIDGRNDEPWVWRVPTLDRVFSGGTGGPGQAVVVRNTPPDLWGTQREHDQAITAVRVGGVDRVWLGGKGKSPTKGGEFGAAVYAFDVIETGQGAPKFGPAMGVSRTKQHPNGDGADIAGFVGNNIHADVHRIRVLTLDPDTRHVWVTSDGGVYASELGGRVNTFQSRNNGLAILEPGFIAVHPSSSQYCGIGTQDNGVQVRSGDTVWDTAQKGDGGGVMFHPTASQYFISQYTYAYWEAVPKKGFQDPLARTPGGGGIAKTDREYKLSAFYSGCDAIADGNGGGRIAIGTNRVWVSDDLGTAKVCTWKVLPADPLKTLAAQDARPSGTDPAKLRKFGVPNIGDKAKTSFGPVVQLRWVTPKRLYAVYLNGIVRYDQANDGKWDSMNLLQTGLGIGPDLSRTSVTDIAPVGTSTDFYVSVLGDDRTDPAKAVDTCWYFDGSWHPTELRKKLGNPATPGVLGPLDPAHAVVVDPDDPTTVYVGTFAGVWVGTRQNTGTHTWVSLMNGLPVTSVADLKLTKFRGEGGRSVKLLRAATQSRGVWEVMLGAEEPSRTYLRVHPTDDRRLLPSSLKNPGLAPTEDEKKWQKAYASPDVVIRPSRRLAAESAVPFPLKANQELGPSHLDSYHLWTFQTAFRWLFPAVRADGQWTDQLSDLLRFHRHSKKATLKEGGTINKATWDDVVGRTRLDNSRSVSTADPDDYAVFETPWQPPGTTLVPATEVDVAELVVPQSAKDGIWNVYAEPSTVDVLLHHRDTRHLIPNDAYTALFLKSGSDPATLLAELASTFSALFTWNGTAGVPEPTGWSAVLKGTSKVHHLSTTLDAFNPRAISVDVNLASVAKGRFILFLAVCGSSAETPPPPVDLKPTSTIVDLVRAWPRAALRLVQVVGPRPTTSPT